MMNNTQIQRLFFLQYTKVAEAYEVIEWKL